MLGFIITGGLCFGWACLGLLLMGKLRPSGDFAANFGLGGLISVGLAGALSGVILLIPGSAHFGLIPLAIAAIAGAGIVIAKRGIPRPKQIKDPVTILLLLVAIYASLFALVGVLSPSTASDWDSLAYHMAVPKLYLAAGQMVHIPFIHHAHFPSDVEILSVWGLQYGGESGAKAFVWFLSFFGGFAIFGLARERFSAKAAWWCLAVFAVIPSVVWESGTAYIDVAHGLFAGLGLVLLMLACEAKDSFWVPGLLFGLALGTKYTGIETFGVAILGAAIVYRASAIKPIALVGIVAVVLSSPWYIKNVVWEGNPVYPFLYEKLGGKDWDQKRADVYREEQESFGVGINDGHRNWADFPHAVLGLAYQPGRYVNPGQAVGGGDPNGAIGFAIVVLAAGLCLVVKKGKVESAVLVSTGLSCVVWYGLSEQSRYFLNTAIPLIPISGALFVAESDRVVRVVAATAVSLQVLVTGWIQYTLVFKPNVSVLFGKESRDDFQKERIPFFEASQAINQLPSNAKVGLYDEVFGFLLDRPYMWANPNHSRLTGTDDLSTGADFVQMLHRNGVNYLYVAFVKPKEDREWVSALGLTGSPTPLPDKLRLEWQLDWMQKWKALLTDGVTSGKIVPVQTFRAGALFSVQ